VDGGLQPVSLGETGDGVRIFSVLPSLDTPVCDIQTKRFNTEAATMPNIKIYTISMDLPFAQKRYCDAFAVDNVKMLSDHKNGSFGAAYGTLIKEWRVESRAIFVVDKNNIIQHAEYVKEVADHPDYERRSPRQNNSPANRSATIGAPTVASARSLRSGGHTRASRRRCRRRARSPRTAFRVLSQRR
jgi:thiol peroxidase